MKILDLNSVFPMRSRMRVQRFLTGLTVRKTTIQTTTETKPKKLLTAKMGKKPTEEKTNKQPTPEEARAAKEAKKQEANNEAARRAALKNSYAISQGEEGKRGGPTTKEEYERRQAAEANRAKNVDSHRTKSSGNIYSGVTKKSEANDAIAESRENERKSKQLALTNPEKAQSEKAAAEKHFCSEFSVRRTCSVQAKSASPPEAAEPRH